MGEPGGLPSMGSHRVGHDLSDLAAAAAAAGATPQCVPKAPLSAASYYLLSKWVRVLLSLIFVPKIRPMKTVSTGQVFSRFFSRL